MSRNLILAASLLVLALILAACQLPAAGPTATDVPAVPTQEITPALPGGETLTGLALVDSIDILTLESFPVQINVVARGNLPDGCTTIDRAISEKEDSHFRITLTTRRPVDAICTEALVPYEQVIPLEVRGLLAGMYTVDVNGTTGSFELAVDNVLPEDIQAPATGSISGTVWHDLCAIAGGEGGEPAIPSSGCVEAEDGGYRGNGIFEQGEPGIQGVVVELGEGQCPSTGYATATTDRNGGYRFTNLPPGVYCITVDPAHFDNVPVLIPGMFTFPDVDSGSHELTLDEGDRILQINFGWDYQFLPEVDYEPTPVAGETDCENRVDFVADVTIPDDTTIAASTRFEKTWRLRNAGTCTWNTSYNLVFSSGDQMGVSSPARLTASVPPGEEAELSITFTAPNTPGTYRSEWLLADSQGDEFGTGRNANLPFWVQIRVIETLASQNLGDPTYVDNFNSDARFFLVNTANTRFSIDDGELVMESISPGGLDEWGLADHPPVSDFYLEAEVRTGDVCSGLDRYGLLVRSPDPNQGYVYGFSCDGRFRIYGWDGNSYISIQEWTANSSIKSGAGETNTIGILIRGNVLKLYANGTLLTELRDNTFSQGRFGLFVSSRNTSNFKAYVDRLSLWDLED
jgi:hypothetical protein